MIQIRLHLLFSEENTMSDRLYYMHAQHTTRCVYLGTHGCNKKRERDKRRACTHTHLCTTAWLNHTFHSTDESVFWDCSVRFVSKFTGNDATALPTKHQWKTFHTNIHTQCGMREGNLNRNFKAQGCFRWTNEKFWISFVIFLIFKKKKQIQKNVV